MDFKKHYEYCCYILSKREYSVFKIRSKLKQRGLLDAEINQIIEELQSKSFLSDERFAKAKIRSLIRRGESNKSIRFKLSHEMISVENDDIDFEREELECDEHRSLVELALKKIRKHSTQDKSIELSDFKNLDQKSKDSIIRSLLAKGFSYDKIKSQFNL